MDEVPNSDANIDNQGLNSTTIPWENEFDCDDIEYLSEIFGLHQEQPVGTTNVISTTSIENSEEQQQPTTIPIHDEDDDYSLSYIYSMGLKHIEGTRKNVSSSDGINQKNLKTDHLIPVPIIDLEKQGDDTINNSSTTREQQVIDLETSDMTLQQPMQKIPILEIYERESSMKRKFAMDDPFRISNPKDNNLPVPKIPCFGSDHSMKPPNHSSFGLMEQEYRRKKPKFFMDHTYGISTSRRAGEQQNPKTNGHILQQSMPPTLEKLESELMMKSKYGIFEQGIGNVGSSRKEDEICYGILNSSDNDQFLQNPRSSRYQPLGIASDYDDRYKMLRKSDSSQNSKNEEALIGRRSSNPITNNIPKFKGVESGQNSNQYTQENGNIGAPDQSQSSSSVQSWNAQDTHLNFNTNWPEAP